MFQIPNLRIDPDGLPAQIMTSDPGSFARETFESRIPNIEDEVIRLNSFPIRICQALERLREEILTGPIQEIREEAPDTEFWNDVSGAFIGRSWLEVPWYWAEVYFYRRLLEATCFFQTGPWEGVDPCAPQKEQEWSPEKAPRSVSQVCAGLPSGLGDRFVCLFHASLWGNRIDLSRGDLFDEDGSTHGDVNDVARLLVDDSLIVWEFIQSGSCQRLDLVLDNAGTELLHDLALVDFLLTEHLTQKIVLHLKPQPVFVSDATPADFESGMQALVLEGGALQALQQRLQVYLEEGSLQLLTHWFYVSSFFCFQMPDDLDAEFASADLVFFKGDVNYRRLVGDFHWNPTLPYADVTSYFPTPCASLRTLKGELIVGLKPGQVQKLRQEDPDWMVNGRRGVIQARLG